MTINSLHDFELAGRKLPFRVHRTNGEFVSDFRHFTAAEDHARMLNKWALDNGRLERYIVNEPNTTDTPQEAT